VASVRFFRNLTNLVAATLLPFVLVALLAMPLEEVLKALSKFLL
jgi:hypothetical protein